MNIIIDVFSKMALFFLVVILVIFIAYPIIRVTTKAAFLSYFESKHKYDKDRNTNEKEETK